MLNTYRMTVRLIMYIWSEWICTRGPRPQLPSRNQKEGIGKTMESYIKTEHYQASILLTI